MTMVQWRKVVLKVLDHSSSDALKADLERHRDSVLQYEPFDLDPAYSTSPRWRFVKAELCTWPLGLDD